MQFTNIVPATPRADRGGKKHSIFILYCLFLFQLSTYCFWIFLSVTVLNGYIVDRDMTWFSITWIYSSIHSSHSTSRWNNQEQFVTVWRFKETSNLAPSFSLFLSFIFTLREERSKRYTCALSLLICCTYFQFSGFNNNFLDNICLMHDSRFFALFFKHLTIYGYNFLRTCIHYRERQSLILPH